MNRRLFNPSMKKQRGFSLLEILIVAALVAAGLAGLFFLVNRYNTKQVTNDEASSLNSIAAEVRTKFRSQGNYNGITPQVLINNGIVPPTKINGANIETGWNTNVAIAAANLNGTAGDSVSFTYTIPRESCADFVQAAEGSFPRISVGGTNVKDVPGGQRTLNIATLGTQCDAGAGGNVAAVFTLGR